MTDLKQRESGIRKTLIVLLGVNLSLALIKLLVGSQFHYFSLFSSGLDSLFDGTSNLLGIFSIYFAFRPADEKHPYGHYKYETLGGLLMSLLLFLTAINVGKNVVVLWGEKGPDPQFGVLPVLAILVPTLIGQVLYFYENKRAKEFHSKVLAADSKHIQGDVFLGLGVLLSIVAARFNLYYVDSVVGLFICLYLFYVAFGLIKLNIEDLLDSSPAFLEELKGIISSVSGVKNCHKLRARGNKMMMYVDYHLLLDETLSLKRAHELAHETEEKVRQFLGSEIGRVDVTVHVEPFEKEHRDEI